MGDPAPVWQGVDRYIEEHLVPADPVLDEALRQCLAAGLPSIQVSPVQGKFLHLLARAIGARRVLEIGTLGGYSAIWLGRAVGAEGRVVTLELQPRHAEVARSNLARAGLAARVEVRVGDARDLLARLHEERPERFDLVFIDADRPHYDQYLDWAVRLGRVGTIIVVDNVVKAGAVAFGAKGDPGLDGVRRLTVRLGTHPALEAIEMQTVGAKGHDGFALALVVAPA